MVVIWLAGARGDVVRAPDPPPPRSNSHASRSGHKILCVLCVLITYDVDTILVSTHS